MLDFVFGLLEVEVMEELVRFARDVLKIDLEFEFTPAVLCDTPWRRLEYFAEVSRSSCLREPAWC